MPPGVGRCNGPAACDACLRLGCWGPQPTTLARLGYAGRRSTTPIGPGRWTRTSPRWRLTVLIAPRGRIAIIWGRARRSPRPPVVRPRRPRRPWRRHGPILGAGNRHPRLSSGATGAHAPGGRLPTSCRSGAVPFDAQTLVDGSYRRSPVGSRSRPVTAGRGAPEARGDLSDTLHWGRGPVGPSPAVEYRRLTAALGEAWTDQGLSTRLQGRTDHGFCAISGKPGGLFTLAGRFGSQGPCPATDRTIGYSRAVRYDLQPFQRRAPPGQRQPPPLCAQRSLYRTGNLSVRRPSFPLRPGTGSKTGQDRLPFDRACRPPAASTLYAFPGLEDFPDPREAGRGPSSWREQWTTRTSLCARSSRVRRCRRPAAQMGLDATQHGRGHSVSRQATGRVRPAHALLSDADARCRIPAPSVNAGVGETRRH